MDLYDPQTLGVMVFGGFMVISAIGIFLVSTFSMKETSYEEALAKQRKVLEKAQQPKGDKKKKEKPIEKKGKAKKREDKPNGKIPEQDSSQDMNDSSRELDSEPEIIAEFVLPEPSVVTISAPPAPPPSVQEKPVPSPKDKKRKEKKATKVETTSVPVVATSAQAVTSKTPPLIEVFAKEAPVVCAPPVAAQSSIPVAARLPTKKAEVASLPTKKAEVASLPSKKAEVAALPSKKAEVAALPSKKAEVAALPSKKAEVAALPSKKAEVASQPSKKAEVASQPSKKAEVASQPSKKAEVASQPSKKAEVASQPSKKAEVASQPSKKAEVASQPTKKVDVASLPSKKADVASQPTKKTEATSLPVKKVDAVLTAVKKTEVASLSVKKVDSGQSQEEPKQETAIKKKSVPKKKAEPSHTDTDGPLYLPYASLLSTVGSMTFSEGEAQRLIEVLTEKAGIVQDTWHTATQKGDLVSTLKRQLEEKEKLLSAELEDTAAAKNKLRELNKELAAEKVKAAGVESKLKEQLVTREQEINAVQARMQATYQDHVGETQQLQVKIRSLQEQLENGPNTQLTRLQQENTILRDALNQATSQMESKQNAELAKLRQECSKLTKEVIEKSEVLQQEEQLRKSLDTKVVAFEKQVGQLQVSQRETEDILQKRLEEVSEELRRSQSSYKSLQTETEKSKEEQKIVSDLQTKLLSYEEESKSKSLELENHIEKLLAVNSENKQLTERIRAIEALLEASQSSEAEQDKELQAAKQTDIIQLEARLQERDSRILSLENEALQLKSSLEEHTLQNNEANPAEIISLQTRLKERDEQIANLQQEALQLLSRVEVQPVPNNATEQTEVTEIQTRLQQKVDLISSLEKEVAELKETVEQQRIKHNATQEAEIQLQSRLQQKDDLIARLENEATKLKETAEQQRIPNNAEGQEVIQLQTRLQEKDNLISSLEKEAAELQASMEQQRIKNNDLREKNWQAMEALGLAEKTCAEKVTSCKKTQEETEKQLHTLQKQTKETLLSLFPQITVVSDEVYSEWLQEFKEKSTEILSRQTTKTDYPDLSPQLREAEEAHSTLQAECDQYRTILAETEGMLRNLQRSVEQEEVVWKAKLAKAEEDLLEAQAQMGSFEETVEKLKLDLQNADQLKECISLMEAQLDSQMFSANSACQNYSKEVESLQQLLQESQEQLESAKNEARKQSKELSLVRQHLSEMKIHVHDGEAVGSQADQTDQTGQEPDELKSHLEQTEATLNEEQTLRQKLAEEFEEAAESAFSVRTELAKLRFEGDFTADAEEVAQLKVENEEPKNGTSV